MFSAEQLSNMLFLDIETVTSHKDLQTMQAEAPALAYHWPAKANLIRKGKPEIMHLNDAEVYQSEAPLYTEFSKTVCVSIGQLILNEDGSSQFKSKSFYGHDEAQIIEDLFKAFWALFRKNPSIKLVGHNIKGFDMPFLLRKAVKYGLAIPHQLHLHAVKPWDNCLLDTSEIWKFGSWTGAPLGLLCTALDIPTPKDEMYGSEVNDAYWADRLDEIVIYCEKDVRATANVMLKFAGLPLTDYAL